MIDIHLHCRDWGQCHKETIAHARSVALRAGISAIFDMPNTDPPITTRELVEKRLALAKESDKTNVFYGLYMGLTANGDQIREAVRTHRDLSPHVAGLKMFAGRSVGNLGITEERDQQNVYKVLSDESYTGILAVHCEKESLLKPELWDTSNPVSHSYARPPEAEIESVRDQIRSANAAGFKGKLHILHVSVPESVDMIDRARREGRIRISCGLTPHHCLLNTEMVKQSPDGILCKVNPPIRSRESAQKMFEYLHAGKIDLIETDHAPHTLSEKTGKALDKDGKPVFMSGFPGLHFLPHFARHLRNEGFSEDRILQLMHHNPCRLFGLEFPLWKENNFDLGREYEVDVHRVLGLTK